MRDFTLHASTRLYCGKGCVAKTGRILKTLGHDRVLLLFGGRSSTLNGALATVTASLDKHGIAWSPCGDLRPNPDLEQLQRVLTALAAARQAQEPPTALVAIGGGSVLDTAKATAAAALHDAPPWELFTARREITRALPVLAVSTLAGSGSETNAEAVCRNPESGETLALRGPALYPAAAFVDPTLQAGLDWSLTRRGAVDMLSHVLERALTVREPQGGSLLLGLAEALQRGILARAAELRREPTAYAPRAELCWAAMTAQSGPLASGLGVGDWTVHVLAHAVTGTAPHLPHGDVVAVLLPRWLEALAGLRHPGVTRWAREVLGARSGQAGAQSLRAIFLDWGLPGSLAALGLGSAQLELAAERATAMGLAHGGLGRAAPMQDRIHELLLP